MLPLAPYEVCTHNSKRLPRYRIGRDSSHGLIEPSDARPRSAVHVGSSPVRRFLGSGGRSPPARRVVNRLLDRKAIIHLPRVRDPPQDCNVWVPNIRRRSSRVVGSSCDPASGIQPGALWVG